MFDFQMGRGREGPKRFLGGFGGISQTDGHVAYDKVSGPGCLQAARWAHARRMFVEAARLQPGDERAVAMVNQMDVLSAVDREAREHGLDVAARAELRRQGAVELVEGIFKAAEDAKAGSLPASALARAAAYTLALRAKLKRFLEWPKLELSNNLA